jgi:predicted DNA-binding transcriptional regulator AlpA
MPTKHSGIQRRLRYTDLVERRIINNRVTLQNWINKQGFPPGQLTGPNSRTWGENDVQRWLDSRPVAPKESPNPKRRPGRPRKAQAEQQSPMAE